MVFGPCWNKYPLCAGCCNAFKAPCARQRPSRSPFAQIQISGWFQCLAFLLRKRLFYIINSKVLQRWVRAGVCRPGRHWHSAKRTQRRPLDQNRHSVHRVSTILLADFQDALERQWNLLRGQTARQNGQKYWGRMWQPPVQDKCTATRSLHSFTLLNFTLPWFIFEYYVAVSCARCLLR